MISRWIYQVLWANAVLNPLVGTRIFPNRAVQGEDMPYLVYRQVSKIPTNDKDGGTGFDRYRMQIDIVDDSYTGCELLGSYVRTALDRQSGYVGGFGVFTAIYENETDTPPLEDEGSTKVYMKSMDFMIIAK